VSAVAFLPSSAKTDVFSERCPFPDSIFGLRTSPTHLAVWIDVVVAWDRQSVSLSRRLKNC
jgi:hypothetical protein